MLSFDERKLSSNYLHFFNMLVLYDFDILALSTLTYSLRPMPPQHISVKLLTFRSALDGWHPFPTGTFISTTFFLVKGPLTSVDGSCGDFIETRAAQ